jgi:hypothetical protein
VDLQENATPRQRAKLPATALPLPLHTKNGIHKYKKHLKNSTKRLYFIFLHAILKVQEEKSKPPGNGVLEGDVFGRCLPKQALFNSRKGCG